MSVKWLGDEDLERCFVATIKAQSREDAKRELDQILANAVRERGIPVKRPMILGPTEMATGRELARCVLCLVLGAVLIAAVLGVLAVLRGGLL